MAKVYRVGLDMLGGAEIGNPPISHLERSIEALAKVSKEYQEQNVVFVAAGPEKAIKEGLRKYASGTNIEFKDVPIMFELGGKFENYEDKTTTISALAEMLSKDEVDVLCSDGETGATARYVIENCGWIERGIGLRPCIVSKMPRGINDYYYLCDAGANKQARPNHLKHNAILAEAYLRHCINIKDPRVGLLQGPMAQLALSYLKSMPFRFVGIIEPKEIYENKADLVITGGFDGNIVLKGIEAVADCTMKRIEAAKQRNFAKLRFLLGRDKLLAPYYSPNGHEFSELKTLANTNYDIITVESADEMELELVLSELAGETEQRLKFAVLSNGEEESKGDLFAQKLAKSLHKLQNNAFQYVGFVEPYDLLKGEATREIEGRKTSYKIDAVFTHSLIARLLMDTIRSTEDAFLGILQPIMTRFNAVFRKGMMKEQLRELKEKDLNPANYNYGIILGSKKAIKGHAHASVYGIEQLLRQGAEFSKKEDFIPYLQERLKNS